MPQPPTTTNLVHSRLPSHMKSSPKCDGKIAQDLPLGQFYCVHCGKLAYETPIGTSRIDHPRTIELIAARKKAGRVF